MKPNDKWMLDLSQNISFHFGPNAIPVFEGGFSQNFHGVETADITASSFTYKEHLTVRSLAKDS